MSTMQVQGNQTSSQGDLGDSLDNEHASSSQGAVDGVTSPHLRKLLALEDLHGGVATLRS